mgnify:CR=1 FL=1
MEHEAGVLFSIGPLEVTGTVTTMWAIILVISLVAYLSTRRLNEIPGPLQTAAEMALSSLEDFFAGTMGRVNAKKYLPIFATFFIFIIVSNYSGVLPGAGHVNGFSVPTACLSVTAALSVLAFFTTHIIGVKEVGWKTYLRSFIKPFILLLPLNLIEQLIRPFSLALRLYGNLYGEEMVTSQLYNVFPILLPLIMNALSLIFCLIQAKVFTMLLSIYVTEGIESGH